MLVDVIRSEIICGKHVVSILEYSVEPEDRYWEDGHEKYYEIRISWNDSCDDFDDYAKTYDKKDSFKLFDNAKEYVKKEYEAEKERQLKEQEMKKPVAVHDQVTGHVFNFKNHYDKYEFFNAWDRLVVNEEVA